MPTLFINQIRQPVRFQRGKRLFSRAMSVALVSILALGNLSGLALAETLTPKIVEYTLPTGQTLYIKEDHSQPIITIDTWVKTGSVNETAKINGVSHFLEHLLFKGTDKYKPGEIDRLLEARGSEFNAATSDDFTHYYITTATPYFEEALKLHADMMVNAAIPTTELPQERKVVQEEINRANDNPDRQLYTELSKLMYGKHGYALDTLGPKENIANIPRESILEYYHYWYQPQNFNTIIVGDVDPEKAKKLVASTFPAPPFVSPKDYKAPGVGPVAPPNAAQSKVLQNPNISQAYIALGMLGPAQQKPEDVYALDIAMLALGSGKSSRLYRALKESKPLATSVSAGNYTQKYSGLLVVKAEATPDNRDAVKQEILSQLRTLKAKGITQAELDKAKTQYLKDFIFENETTDGTASSIGYNVTIGSLQDYLDHVSNVEKVTLDKVQSALNQYINLNKAVMVELLPSSMEVNLKTETDTNLALLKGTPAPTETTAPATAQAATQPGQPQAPAQSDAKAQTVAPQKTVLPNGMTLISQPLKDSSTVAIKIFVKGGQGVESIPGTAALVSSVMMQGTQSRTAQAISRELESKGMSLIVSSDEDYIEITGSAIQEDLGELFVILKDVLNNPVFDDKEIAKKKEQIRQSIAASRDNPSTVAFENLTMALYPHHPYGNEGKRIEANLEKITRQDLLDYYHLYFEPQNMVASVVGIFDPNTVQNYLSSLYPECKSCPKSAVEIPPVPKLAKDEVITEEKPQLSAVWMAQGWLVPPISAKKDYATLKVINSLIGTGMSSRLFVDLREKQGLAYVVGSMYPSREQESRFVIYIGTDPANTDKVRAGFTQEIKRLQTEPVSATELAEAKSKLIGSFALAHDTNINKAFYLGLYETLGAGYEFDATYPNLVEQVTAADIQRVSQTLLATPSVLSLVKPAPKAKSSDNR
jgi:zinc protease